MRATQKLRNVFQGLLKRYGTENIKKWLWNHEYKLGLWNCLENMPADYVYPHVEKYARNGNILDLGCGPGTVGSELNAAAYRFYTGVDISDVAIEKAKQRTEENGRTDRNEYCQSDISTYLPKQQYDVILFGDSIYFPDKRIAEMLARYSKYLKQDGVFIVRTWFLSDRQRAIVRNIENNFDVVEKRFYHESQLIVIVFQPPASRRAALLASDHS